MKKCFHSEGEWIARKVGLKGCDKTWGEEREFIYVHFLKRIYRKGFGIQDSRFNRGFLIMSKDR